MNPQIEAALIAGIISLISLGGTVVVARWGFQATMQATKMAADESHIDTADTLEVQREQLDRTLTEQHTRTLNERFAVAAEKLGADKPPAVRLAGIYAMAGLADDWEENRQTCIDVLCGYLRISYVQEPADGDVRVRFLADLEVRHTVIRVITAHLRDDAKVSWCGSDLDFTGVVFDGGDFSRARFSGGRIDFTGAVFSGGTVDFTLAVFSGGRVHFTGAVFSGGTVDFTFAEFDGGDVSFDGAKFSGGNVGFDGARFCGSTVHFGQVLERTGFYSHYFNLSGSLANLDSAELRGAEFSGGAVDFTVTEFRGGTVNFGGARFSGGAVGFGNARFFGGKVNFRGAEFSGSRPKFDWTTDAEVPAGVTLPDE